MDSKKQALIESASQGAPHFTLSKSDKALRISARLAATALMFAAGTARAGGGGLGGITASVGMVAGVVAACGALIATIGIGICGYKVVMEGATFRDISNKLLGCGIIGGAAAIAGAFSGGGTP